MFYTKNFIKKRLQHRATLNKLKINNKSFSYEYCEIFKNTYFEEHLETTASDFFHVMWQFFATPLPGLNIIFDELRKDTNLDINFVVLSYLG